MRTDRELLELAAKAAGVQGQYRDVYGPDVGHDASGITKMIQPRWGHPLWNPLTDDGDALRLAADLDLFGSPSYWHWLAIARLENSVDKHANVRRAIVRAAAEIGAQTHPDNKDGGANG